MASDCSTYNAATEGYGASFAPTGVDMAVRSDGSDCGFSCPTLSTPPKTSELKSLKADIDNQLEANREFVSSCSGQSILSYMDSIVVRQSCLMDQLILALDGKANK